MQAARIAQSTAQLGGKAGLVRSLGMLGAGGGGGGGSAGAMAGSIGEGLTAGVGALAPATAVAGAALAGTVVVRQ